LFFSRSQKAADSFYHAKNGVLFDSFSSECCAVLFAVKVDFIDGMQGGSVAVSIDETENEKEGEEETEEKKNEAEKKETKSKTEKKGSEKKKNHEGKKRGKQGNKKSQRKGKNEKNEKVETGETKSGDKGRKCEKIETQNTIIPSGMVELPTCPVCLERMDVACSGIITILCNHSFHCECLSRWRGDASRMSSCPVCRYSQLPPNDTDSSYCSVCRVRFVPIRSFINFLFFFFSSVFFPPCLSFFFYFFHLS